MTRHCTNCGLPTNQIKDNLWVCKNKHDNWINPAAGAIVYVLKDDKVLYGVRSIEPNSGKLSLPGGFIEIGESAETAAIREVKEELGISVTLIDYLGSYPSEYASGIPTINIVFIAKYSSGEIVSSDDMSGGDPIWRDINNLPKQDGLAWEWYNEAQKDFIEWHRTHTA